MVREMLAERQTSRTPLPQTGANGCFTCLETAPDVACQQQSIVNLYLVGPRGATDGGWVLVDAGLTGSAGEIAGAAVARFGNSRPACILLTHGHFDHVGAVRELAERWDVPVFAHELELPYLTGRSSYPPPDPAVGGGAMSFLSRLYPRGPIDLGDRILPLPSAGNVPGLPGWRWLHTPGHTAGHVSFFRESDRTLIVGDAFVTTKQESALAVLTRYRQVSRPPAYYTTDWEAARRSVQLLANLQPEIALTGHGLPMHGHLLRSQLNRLVANWAALAVPSWGRYVRRPAVTDRNGVVFVPPAVLDPQLVLLAGVGAGLLLGRCLRRS